MSIPRATHHLDLVLLSVLAAISLISCGAAAAAALPEPVYDTDGHELSADADYYVLPDVTRGSTTGTGGGGLTLASNGPRCPLFVTQEADRSRKGFPVRFTPQQQGQDRTVRVGSDVRVLFAAVTWCEQTTVWHVPGEGDGGGDDSSGRRRRLVRTGPVLSPTPTTGREMMFRVEKHGGPHGHGYKLVWCGTTTSASSCQDLGLLRDHGDRRPWLGTTWTGGAHAVVFVKAATRRA